jgi:hypothetical protein
MNCEEYIMNLKELETELFKVCSIPVLQFDGKFYIKLKGMKESKYIPITAAQLSTIEGILTSNVECGEDLMLQTR